MTEKSLKNTISLWAETKKIRNTRQVSFLNTSLKIYILPKMGYRVAGLSPSKFSDFCAQINILEFNLIDTLGIFDQVFEERLVIDNLSLSTKRNYRSALGQFLNWIENQDWYVKVEQPAEIPELPRRVYAKRSLSKTYDGKRLYGLSKENLTTEISLDLEAYEVFWRQGSSTLNSLSILKPPFQNPVERRAWRLEQAELEAQNEKYTLSPVFKGVKESTITQRKDYILRFLGWCVNIEGYSIDELSLQMITTQSLYKPYVNWLIEERSCGSTVGIKLLDTAISVAKYYFFEASNTVDWSDITFIDFLLQEKRLYQEQDKIEQPIKKQEKWEQKEITHDEARQVVEYLYRTICSPRYFLVREDGSKVLTVRSLSTIFDNWQTYLMIKILVYAPIRQEELRKLVVDGTLMLVEDSDGIFRYAVRIKEHKRVSKTRKPRYYPLPSTLTHDIKKFIQEIRPLAINAPSKEDSWLKFWDLGREKIARLEQRIQKAETADIPDRKYIDSAKIELRAMQNRLNAWEVAKANSIDCNHLFFALGRSHPRSFCVPFEEVHHGSITGRIVKAMGNATLTLFGEAKFLNPNGFRHIGAKHVRVIGKSNQKGKFSEFIGHSVEIDDMYADQIISDYDLIECIVDDWWHES